jgi:hypothetical protein
VHDRGLERSSDGEELVVGSLAAGTGKDRDVRRDVEDLRGRGDRIVGGTNDGGGGTDRRRSGVVLGVMQEDLAGDHHDGDASALDRMAHRDLQDPWQLLGHADQLRIDAALTEQLLRMRLLEIAAADLVTWDVGGDREHRHPATVRVKQTVDQMEVPRATAGGADREFPGHRRLTRRGERRRLFVTNVLPDDIAVAAQCIGEAIDRISRQPIDPADPGCLEGRHDEISNRGWHYCSFPEVRFEPLASSWKAAAVPSP